MAEKLQHLERKLSKNHQNLVPVLVFGWKLLSKGKERIKQGFPCISEAIAALLLLIGDDISSSWYMSHHLVRLHRAHIGILTMVVFWGVEMARGMSQSPGRRADEDAGG